MHHNRGEDTRVPASLYVQIQKHYFVSCFIQFAYSLFASTSIFMMQRQGSTFLFPAKRNLEERKARYPDEDTVAKIYCHSERSEESRAKFHNPCFFEISVSDVDDDEFNFF